LGILESFEGFVFNAENRLNLSRKLVKREHKLQLSIK
jgi:hypothetical protein